jgi:hypothetical protein
MNSPKDELLNRFAADVQRHYGDRVLGIYVFDYLLDEGDDDEISVDADVAVVLSDGDWRFLDEKKQLVRLTFDILVETGFYIRAWPFPVSAWRDPSAYSNPRLVREIKQHAEPIMEVA